MDGETLEDIQQHLKAKHEAVLRKITHKMNNILQAMVGNADMGLLELGNSSQLTKRFDNIIGGIDEIRNITKVMTNIYEPGKLIIETTHVTDLVDKIILKYSNVMQMDGIKLSKCYGSDINVITYTEYLYDIIEAIIVNAIQGLGQNDKDARILNIYINKEGSNVKIKIISNSSGIVPDILGKVTIGELTAKPFKNGLEKHIVNILGLVIGATINTKSEPGKDTNVEITIPLVLPSVALGKERQKLNRQLNKL